MEVLATMAGSVHGSGPVIISFIVPPAASTSSFLIKELAFKDPDFAVLDPEGELCCFVTWRCYPTYDDPRHS